MDTPVDLGAPAEHFLDVESFLGYRVGDILGPAAPQHTRLVQVLAG